MKHLLIGLAVSLAGCTTAPPKPGNPLIQIACPDLAGPADDTFGATTIALVKVSEQYYKCRAAASTQ